jgi:hypothetical protein
MPSRNPLPLSSSQEAAVREIYYGNVRAKCAEEIKSKSSILRRSSCLEGVAGLCEAATTPLEKHALISRSLTDMSSN